MSLHADDERRMGGELGPEGHLQPGAGFRASSLFCGGLRGVGKTWFLDFKTASDVVKKLVIVCTRCLMHQAPASLVRYQKRLKVDGGMALCSSHQEKAPRQHFVSTDNPGARWFSVFQVRISAVDPSRQTP